MLCREGAAPGDGPALSPQCYTASKNPYLFPLNVLSVSCQDDSPPNTPEDDGSSGSNADSDVDAPRWWLVHTKPRQEKKLSDDLRKYKIAHFMPATKATALTRGRPRQTWAPLFPGYLFMRASADERFEAFDRTKSRIVAVHSVRAAARLSRQLFDVADLVEREAPLRIEERLVAGQRVRVKSGPLADKRGIIIRRGGKAHLVVLVEELMGGVSTQIELHRVEPY